jgi:hypothetical protein
MSVPNTNRDRSPSASSEPGQAQMGTIEQDLAAPIEFHAAGNQRLQVPLFEIGLTSVLTLIYFFNGGYGQFRHEGSALADIGAIVLLLLFWGVAFVHLYSAWRYVVQLDEQGVTLINGLFRRRVRWDEAFLAEWRAKTTSQEGEIHTAWTMEIRDAAGQVKMRLDGALLERDRLLLERLINYGLRRHNMPAVESAQAKE